MLPPEEREGAERAVATVGVAMEAARVEGVMVAEMAVEATAAATAAAVKVAAKAAEETVAVRAVAATVVVRVVAGKVVVRVVVATAGALQAAAMGEVRVVVEREVEG